MSGYWPTAEITVSTSTSYSEPSTGTGRRRPEASGSPSSILSRVSDFTAGPSTWMETGAASSTRRMPSSSASSISASEAGISSRVRR